MQNIAKVSQNVAVNEERPILESYKLDKGGRPLKLSDPEQVREMLEGYFKTTKENEWTITGVCMALGIDRDTIVNIERKYPERGGNKDVIRLIKDARLKIHNSYEVDLRNKNNPAGSIFALKNFGWSDQQQIDHTSGGQAFNVKVMAFDSPAVDVEYTEVDDNQ